MNAVALLRAKAKLVDAEFDRQELRAAMNLHAIRMRNAVEMSERLLRTPVLSEASGTCLHCLSLPAERRAKVRT
jgi:hypothetical protein